ncbi:GNAT family N-acetyltransferase [Aquihabitans sp. G128]|uniref:GNAT family N-acetyltransferase n=1 Tax=Aquihabitans sp. G128 TaxID=2849779 RepID=UPI001C21670E|nr:GNAT family N-acetyltransferase [Aquihabitans sp. G128]QXC61119.1 GNAT family N-acetyltransferase [Aquihabitans sp. G128]
MEPLATDRLTIRDWSLEEGDVDRMFAIQSRWEVVRWLDDDPVVMTERAQAVAQVERCRARTDPDGPRGFWAVEERATGLASGTVLLCDLNPEDATSGEERPAPAAWAGAELEVGWHLHPDAWGRGLAREAAAAVVARAFAQGVPAVHALMYVDNEASAKVALALGMEDRGVVTDRWYPGPSRWFHLARP